MILGLGQKVAELTIQFRAFQFVQVSAQVERASSGYRQHV